MNFAALPPTLPVWADDLNKPSARWFFPDLGRGTLYEGVRRGDIPSLRVAGRILLPTQRLLALVGVDAPPQISESNGEGVRHEMRRRHATGVAHDPENGSDPVP